MEKEREIYEQLLAKKRNDAQIAQTSSKHSSSSTVKFDVDVKGSVFYLHPLGDVHDQLLKFIKNLKEDKKIPNMYWFPVGDITTMPIVGSVSNVYGISNTPEDSVYNIVDAIKELGMQDNLVCWLDGNHEQRLNKNTSFRVGRMITESLGCPEKYAENIAQINFNIDNPLKPGEKITFTVLARHGEKTSANVGRKLDQTLKSPLFKGVDLNIDGHTHKIFYGSTKMKVFDPVTKTYVDRNTYSANFGSFEEKSEYAERAGYPLTGRPDGEILRIAVVPNENKTDYSICVDFINRREVLKQETLTANEKLQNQIIELKNREFYSENEIKREYKKVIQNFYKSISKKPKKSLSNQTLFLAPLCGFVVGDKNTHNDKEIEEAIEVLSKLSDCKVILNGDMVFYKQADFWNKEKYPNDTFSYLELLAEKLKPIKDKIIAYNSGVQEERIMKWHGKELAKYAMTRLQMDEKLAYMPYNKTQYRAEQKKIQAMQVEQYNKDTLNIECQKYKLNAKKQEELIKFLTKIGKTGPFNLDNEDILKNCVALKLRAEKKLLSIATDTAEIEELFPLSDIDLREPHENLVQHILCAMLGINPKKVMANSKPNSKTVNCLNIVGEDGKQHLVNIVGGYSKSIAGRGSQEINLSETESKMPGANIYYVNSKAGEEYMSKKRSAVRYNDGTSAIIDSYYISGGRFDNEERVRSEFSTNRLYKFSKCYADQENDPSRSIYANNDPFTLTCSSIDYKSALFDENIIESMGLKMIEESYKETLMNFRRNQIEHSTTLDEIVKKIKEPKNVTVIKQPEIETNQTLDEENVM